MSDEIKVNRPQSPVSEVRERMDVSRTSKMPWVILGLVVVVLIIVGALFRNKLFGGSTAMTTAKSSGYQAVFLTNGQVYFGKMAEGDTNYTMLKDIYYLQVVQQPPLQGSTATSTSQQQPQISLVKLGNELHGPVDEMHISRSQILFYEDMKSDSQVIKAIQSYKANPTGNTATPPAAQQQQQAPTGQPVQ